MHLDASALSLFPFITQEKITVLKKELPSYLAKVESTDDNSDIDCLKWWKRHESTLPIWSDTTNRYILVVQPSFAAVERVFSILNTAFGNYQQNALQDYVEAPQC